MLYGYGRVSTDIQESSRDAQAQTLQAYADRMEEPIELFIDEDVSGSMPLKDRPKGKAMWDRLKPGDTVVVTTKDRAFRSLVDAAITLMSWREQGIKLHILDFPVDLTTDEGEMVFLQGAVFAQYERKQIGRRMRNGIRHRKENGLPYGGARPWGYVRKGNAWVPCEKEQELGRLVLRMRKEGISWWEIACALMSKRKPVTKKNSSGYYHISCVRSLARAAEAGYPIRVQYAWLESSRAAKQPEVKDHDPQK
jgi:DNA invertase Pin-like site-specific DNA recombinase